jgi:hypothetical protein
MPSLGNPVVEQISVNVLATLQNCTVANGYGYDLAITRAKFKNEPAHLNGVIFQVSPDDVQDAGTQSEEWWQMYAVVVYILPTEDDETPIDTYNNACFAAIHNELQKDVTRDGLAVDTVPMPPLFFPPVEGEFGGMTYNFKVHYRTRLDDAFTPAI